MADNKITDPDLIRQLDEMSAVPQPPDAAASGGGTAVTSPELIKQLNAGMPPDTAAGGEQAPGWLSAITGVGKAFGTGVLHHGMSELVGTPADIADIAGKGLEKGAEYLSPGDKEPSTLQKAAKQIHKSLVKRYRGETSAEIEKDIGTVIPPHEAEGNVEKVFEKAGEFVPGALMAPESKASRMTLNALRYGVVPGATSELASQAGQANQYVTDFEKNHPYLAPFVDPAIRTVGAVAGPGVVNRIGRFISPNTEYLTSDVGREALRQKQVLKDAGVRDVTAGDVLKSDKMRSTEQELTPEIGKRQASDFTKASGAPLSMNTDAITTGKKGSLTKVGNTIGKGYDDVFQNNVDWTADHQTAQELHDIRVEVGKTPTHDKKSVKAIRQTIDDTVDNIRNRNDTMTGEEYQDFRSGIRKDARKTDDDLKSQYFNKMADILDKTYERNLVASKSPDVGKVAQLNEDWKKYLTLKDAVGKQGAKASGGEVTPAALARADKRIYGQDAHDAGNTPFSELAKAGQALLTARPDSGTAHRYAAANADTVHNWLRGIGGPLTYLYLKNKGGVGDEGAVGGLLSWEALASALAKPVATKIAQFNNTSLGQKRQLNALYPSPDPKNRAMMQALLAEEAIRPAITGPR
jgi:hypothetical protein